MPDRQASIDSGVSNLLADMKREAEQRRLPVKEKKRQAKERQKMADRNRITLDIPQEIEQRLVKYADTYGCPISQVVSYLLYAGLTMLDQGDWDATHALVVNAKSPRYLYSLDYHKLDNLRDAP